MKLICNVQFCGTQCDAEVIRSFAVFFLNLIINNSKLYKYHNFNTI